MNKLFLVLLTLTVAALGSGCATERYAGQTWYASCKINPNATFPDEKTGEPAKCTDRIRIRQ